MILSAVMDEIAAVAGTIDGLRVYGYPAEEVTPPAACVTYPTRITFDLAFQRGTDGFTAGLMVFVGNVWARTTRDLISAYVDGDGPRSIKAAFLPHDWQSCAYVRPVGVTFDVINLAGVDMLAALFELDIAGPGAED